MTLLLKIRKRLVNKALDKNMHKKVVVALQFLSACLLFSSSSVFAVQAQTVFKNAVVYTVNAKNDIAQAIAVADGKIFAVGSNKEIQKYIGGSTKVVDVKGKVIMPGLVDGHTHPMAGGVQLNGCTLGYSSLTIPEALAIISQCLKDQNGASSDKWLQVQGWFRQAMKPEGADLTAEVLDQLDTDRPVVVVASDFHTLAANTKAQKVAGITKDTKSPSNGKIIRDEDGNATGIFLDGAMWLVSGATPKLSEKDQQAKNVGNAAAALAAFAEQGVTTFFDAAASEDSLSAFEELMKEGKLTARANFAPVIAPDEAADPDKVVAMIKDLGSKYNTPEGSVDPGLSVKTAKIFVDGVIQAPAQTGALVAPYLHNTGTPSDPHWQPSENRGSLYFSEELLTPLITDLAKNGINSHLHTTGDEAIHSSLNAVESMRKVYKGSDIRPIFAHNELIQPGDYKRFAELNVVPLLSLQWGKPGPDTIDSVKDYIGPERFPFLETNGKFHEAGATIAFGSDWPIDPLNEWFAMKVGVTRTALPDAAPEYQGRLGDDPGLDVQTAIRAFTINSAYSLRMEKYVGSLEVGKLADFIVIDQDLRKIDPEKIADTKVLLTVVGGREVYKAEAF